MFRLLTRLFVKKHTETGDPSVRRGYATLASVYGIVLNIILFGAKYFAGTVSGSMAVIADAFNNLSDAGSSVITFIGFRLAGKKPDKGHPFGHGRIEYVAGFIISAIILIVGVELGISSVRKIINPEPVEVGILPAAIMILAILVKFYMFTYNRSAARKIDSMTLMATAKDSLTDCIATAVTLISMGLMYFLHINVDGWAGILVSLFIIYAGLTSAQETLSPLLGQAPDPELVKGIEETVMSHPEVKGIHDLIVNDYGPGRLIISLHAEVNGQDDIFVIHDAIDLAERELNEKYGCIATIHMDPIESDDYEVMKLKEHVLELVCSVYPEASIHDFRTVPGPTHTNLIFDMLLPADCRDSNEHAKELVENLIHERDPEFYGVVHIDRSFV